MGALTNLRDNVVSLFRSAPLRERGAIDGLLREERVDQASALNLLANSIFGPPLDPDEVLSAAGKTRADLRSVMTDPEVATAYDTRAEALLGVPWRLEPVNEPRPRTSIGVFRRADFPEPVQYVWDQLEPQMEGALRAFLKALPYGYSVVQVVYGLVDQNRVGLAQVGEEDFDLFIPQLDGTVRLKTIDKPAGEPKDPRKYILTTREQSRRQPYGDALFTRLFWPIYIRKKIWQFWMRSLERHGTPILMGEASGTTTATELRNELVKAVNSAIVSVSGGSKVSVIGGTATGAAFETFDRVLCGSVQKLILGQTLTTDAGGSSGSSGSYALGQVHNEVRHDRRNADIRMCTKSVQRMVDVLWELNQFPGEPPRFVMEDGTGLEADRATRDATLVNANIVSLTPEYLLRVYDFEAEDIVVNPAPAAPQPAPPATPFSAAGSRFTPKQQAIEDGIAELLGDLPQVVPAASIQAAIRAATSPQDLVEKLAVLLRDADPKAFAETLEKALYAADILGYIHADP